MDKTAAILAIGTSLALGAGGLMALQPAVNSKLGGQCEHPIQASIISFGTGFLALLMVGVLLQIGFPKPVKLATLPAWAWTGGLIGTYMVTVSLMFAPQLGATRWIALVLAGQVTVSLVLDHFGWMGFARQPVNFIRIAGIACIVIGVVLVMRK